MKRMTWGQCKLIALQTMFSNEGAAINVDDSNQDYVHAMPGKANEALQQLATVGRPLLKQFNIRLAYGAEQGATDKELTMPTVDGHYRIDLTEYIPRFRAVDRVMLDAGGAYGEAEEWALEGDTVLVIPGTAGVYTLWYMAYPQTIEVDTADETEIDLPHEAAVLIPLYLAAELYKEDDLSMATVFRNEFEDGLEKLRRAYLESGSAYRGGRVRNMTGWW